MTKGYSKIEFILTLAHHFTCFWLILVIFHTFVYFLPNAYYLPFNCYLFFLPPDGFLFAWELNYLVITVSTTITTLSIASYLPLQFLLMNHSCWLLDMALSTVSDLNDDLLSNENTHDLAKVATTNESLKEAIERFEKFVEWQKDVQDILFWYFELEYQAQSFMLCLSIYVLSFTFDGGVISVLLIFCSSQLYFLCWMGERVASRIDQLSYEISKNWYSMSPHQRKSLQMCLHWSQNMSGFSGLFKAVNLETCKAVTKIQSCWKTSCSFFDRFLKQHTRSMRS